VLPNAGKAMDDWLRERPRPWRRIVIPAELKGEIRDKLDQANITERVLFPGLDGLSCWLRRHYSPTLEGRKGPAERASRLALAVADRAAGWRLISRGDVVNKPSWFYRQSGVVPFRETNGDIELLLITTRKQQRWTIPKGIVEPGMTSSASAIKEAWEEAGIRGFLLSGPLGIYEQQKWGGICRIEVFLFQVKEQAESWPESSFRQRRWFPIVEALQAVYLDELRQLFRQAAGRLADRYYPDGVNPIEELQI